MTKPHELTDEMLEELIFQLRPLKNSFLGLKIQHKQTGNYYIITGFHYRESIMGIEFTYETLHKEGLAFSRPINELMDGRFKFT